MDCKHYQSKTHKCDLDGDTCPFVINKSDITKASKRCKCYEKSSKYAIYALFIHVNGKIPAVPIDYIPPYTMYDLKYVMLNPVYYVDTCVDRVLVKIKGGFKEESPDMWNKGLVPGAIIQSDEDAMLAACAFAELV